MGRRFVAGVDIGATKMTLSVSHEHGVILDRAMKATTRLGPPSILDEMEEMLSGLERRNGLVREDCAGMGVAVAAFVRSSDGHVIFSPNIAGINGSPLGRLIGDRFGVPTLVQNDANAGALGEYRFGAGKGEDFIYVTISSGIGGGLIINGAIYEGPNHLAGEIGHITVDPGGRACGCGKRGCLEAVSSGLGVAAIAADRRAVEETTLRRYESVDAKIVFREARQGDALSSSVVEDAARYLGLALANTLILLGMNRVVVGGGMAREGEYFREKIYRYMRANFLTSSADQCKLIFSTMPDTVVDLGSLELAFAASSQKI